MNLRLHSQVVLFPAQLRRLAELFPEDSAVAIAQNGSVVSAFNGETKVVLDAQGDLLTDSYQETHPTC